MGEIKGLKKEKYCIKTHEGKKCCVKKTNVKNVQLKMNEEGWRVVQTSLLLCLHNNLRILCLITECQKCP